MNANDSNAENGLATLQRLLEEHLANESKKEAKLKESVNKILAAGYSDDEVDHALLLVRELPSFLHALAVCWTASELRTHTPSARLGHELVDYVSHAVDWIDIMTDTAKVSSDDLGLLVDHESFFEHLRDADTLFSDILKNAAAKKANTNQEKVNLEA